jgi:hypothetical protein
MVNLEGRDVESWVNEADTKVREKVKLPEGYTLEFGGQFENLREAKTRLHWSSYLPLSSWLSAASDKRCSSIPEFRSQSLAGPFVMDPRYAVQHFRRGGVHCIKWSRRA